MAFASWLGVHAYLMSGVRSRVDAFVSWGWDYFSTNRTPAIVDRSDAGRIDWGDAADAEDEDERAPAAAPQPDEMVVPDPIRSG